MNQFCAYKAGNCAHKIGICICCWKGMLSLRLVREASQAASTPGFYPGVSQSVAPAAAPAALPHLLKMWRVRRADSQSHKTTNLPCSRLQQHRQHLPGGWGILAEHLQPRSTSCPGEAPVPSDVAAGHGHCVTSAGRSPQAGPFVSGFAVRPTSLAVSKAGGMREMTFCSCADVSAPSETL